MEEQCENKTLSIRFWGGVGTVTGSKFLVEGSGKRVLVDCGLFQGVKHLRLLNRVPLPIEPSSIDAIIITHAHLDHVGALPLLVKQGFSGRIVVTPPTRALAELILRDSAVLQEEEAELANKGGYTKHAPAEPLYTVADVEQTLLHFVVRGDEEWIPLYDGIRFRFWKNGHIPGAAWVELEWEGKTLVFSGDIGRRKSLLLEAPELPTKADVVVMESTYGDRLHADDTAETAIAEAVNETYRRGGMVLIPSFAVGRTQEIMLILDRLYRRGEIPNMPVYLDSPMGVEATKIMQSFPTWHTVSDREERDVWNRVTMIRKYKDTLALLRDKESKIVIAGSGMVTGGRILHYLERYIEDRRSTVLIVGYQAEGTRGRQIVDGAHEVKIHGKFYRVYADIRVVESLSAHADQAGLLHWLSGLQVPPKHLFLVHGEPQAADALRVKIAAERGWDAVVPRLFESYTVGV